jgi:type I restriction enzyme M protein
MTQQTLPLGNTNVDNRRQEVQQAVKSAADALRDDGVQPRDYVEQLSWMFFLKAFEEAEDRREQEAQFDGRPFTRRLTGKHRWSQWSATKDPDKMLAFVDGDLWKDLCDEKRTDSVSQRFQRVFGNVKNHARRGTSFARVVQQVNRLHFGDETDVIVLSELYESLLKDVAADSAGYAGEFYTQRHVIRAMVEVVRPKLGERVYDPCFGTAGFLAEAAAYMRTDPRTGKRKHLAAADLEKLNTATFFGFELRPLTYLLGTMNMLLHGIDDAGLELGNTLERHVKSPSEAGKFQVVLANPPYGGRMATELQTNFTIRSGATEVLFVQHIAANLAQGGRAAVIVPEGVLFRGGPDAKVRERLVTEFDVHTVLSLPAGCFLPYTGVKTNVLFIDRPKSGKTTEKVWFYELTNDGFELKQTRKPIQGSQLPDFLEKQRAKADGERSWSVGVEELRKKGFDLSARNPNRKDDYEHTPAVELVRSIKTKEERILTLLGELEEMLEEEG